MLPPDGPAAFQLSVIARQCIAAICLRRFCEKYTIAGPEIDAFVEHLWGVATVASDDFVGWEQGFQDLPASTWAGPVPESLLANVPESVRADYLQLADAAIESSADTWYCSGIGATIAAFGTVVAICQRHGIPLPPLQPFLVSSPTVRNGWGNRPTLAELQNWRSFG